MPAILRHPAQLSVRLTGPSLATHLGDVRRRLARWAAAAGMTPDCVDDVVLATHEALANVLDHAYPDGAGVALLDASCRASDELVVVVRDRGRWRPPPADPGTRGHGMTIINRLAERVAVSHGRTGTTVEMRWRLPRHQGPTGHVLTPEMRALVTLRTRDPA